MKLGVIMNLMEALKAYKVWLAGSMLLLVGAYYSIVPDMIADWYRDDNYSHGFIIPFIAGYFLYERRDALKSALVDPWWPGILVIILGLMQLTVAWLGTEYFTMRSSLIVVTAGMVLYFFGRKVFKIAMLPILYLIFMVPLPYIIYDAVAFPLKLFVTRVSVAFLKIVGIAVLREGNIIMFPDTTLEVADACSGIRSHVAPGLKCGICMLFPEFHMEAMGHYSFCDTNSNFYKFHAGYLHRHTIAQYWGAKAAEGFFHEFAGLVVFAFAIVLLMALGALLRMKREIGDVEKK